MRGADLIRISRNPYRKPVGERHLFLNSRLPVRCFYPNPCLGGPSWGRYQRSAGCLKSHSSGTKFRAPIIKLSSLAYPIAAAREGCDRTENLPDALSQLVYFRSRQRWCDSTGEYFGAHSRMSLAQNNETANTVVPE